jgi:hypothetical protein
VEQTGAVDDQIELFGLSARCRHRCANRSFERLVHVECMQSAAAFARQLRNATVAASMTRHYEHSFQRRNIEQGMHHGATNASAGSSHKDSDRLG